MKHARMIGVLVVLVLVLGAFAAPAFAGSKTKTGSSCAQTTWWTGTTYKTVTDITASNTSTTKRYRKISAKCGDDYPLTGDVHWSGSTGTVYTGSQSAHFYPNVTLYSGDGPWSNVKFFSGTTSAVLAQWASLTLDF